MRAALADDRSHARLRRSLPSPLRARQGARGRGRLRAELPPLSSRATGCGASASITMPTRRTIRSSVASGIVHPGFFAARAGQGCPRPIRSSCSACRDRARRSSSRSLASHSQVEGTRELPDIQALAHRLSGRRMRSDRSLLSGGDRRSRSRERCARSARNISSASASTARPTGPISSTRCPTTGRMSG